MPVEWDWMCVSALIAGKRDRRACVGGQGVDGIRERTRATEAQREVCSVKVRRGRIDTGGWESSEEEQT